MNTSTHLHKLAEEYVRFKNLDEEELHLMDYIRKYDELITKLEEAGISYYEMDVYASTCQIK